MKMDREQCFKNLIWLEYTDYLDDTDRINYLERYYKTQNKLSKLYFSDRVYLENVLDDYKKRKKKNKDLYFSKFKNENE